MERQAKWWKMQIRDRSEIDLIQELADNRGMNMSDLVRQLIDQERQRQEEEGLRGAQTTFVV